MEKKNGWKVIGIITFIVSIFCLLAGFDKLWAADAYRNSYVGGDAYNLIINASKATAYFVLASFFVLLSIGSGVFYFLGNKESSGSKKVQIREVKEVAIAKEEKKEELIDENSWVCPKCGSKNNMKNLFCNKCGEKKEEIENEIL